MSASQQHVADAALPSPFPEGWYFVASRQELRKANLIQKTWMGEEIIIWCDDQGRVCVAEAYCPHLGSYLGPDAGGRICDGRLVCPFHGFEFDTIGQCVATPFAAPPRSARLKVYETREICGMVFAWWGINGREPQWQLPDEEPEQVGWCDIDIQTLRFPGHPQETTENAVDMAHLRYVHGYHGVNADYPVLVDGPYLQSRFDFSRTQSIAGLAKITLEVSARAHVYGLGYSFVEGREHSIGLDFRLWVLATPIDGAWIDLSLVGQTGQIRDPNRRMIGLSFLPLDRRAPLFNKIFSFFQRRDVLQDVIIWRRKRYRPRPRLCRSDGEIMTYRSYCAQFYPSQRQVLQLPRESARSAQSARR